MQIQYFLEDVFVYQHNKNTLPVLQAIENIFSRYDYKFNNIAFVCVQHLLHTTYNLFNSLVRIGAKPHLFHIMGKSYSTCQNVVSKIIDDGYNYYPSSIHKELGSFNEYFDKDIDYMWNAVSNYLKNYNDIRYVIVLDDGGHCICNIPSVILNNYTVIGVEQTSSGMNKIVQRQPQIPIIGVASSAAKQILEAPMIADAVARKLIDILPINSKSLSCAVVGLGAIGTAVTNQLLALGHKVITYDKDSNKSLNFLSLSKNNLHDLIYASDYVFGCSGYDITEGLDVSTINTNKCFISCSSHDKEFLTLIKYIEKNHPYQELKDGNILCEIKDGVTIKILKKGCPVNFDSSGESVLAQDIQLTRGLLLGGVLQSILSLNDYPQISQNYMLNPNIQQFIVSKWVPYGSEKFTKTPLLENFYDLDWVGQNSKGIYYQDSSIENIFKNNNIKNVA